MTIPAHSQGVDQKSQALASGASPACLSVNSPLCASCSWFIIKAGDLPSALPICDLKCLSPWGSDTSLTLKLLRGTDKVLWRRRSLGFLVTSKRNKLPKSSQILRSFKNETPVVSMRRWLQVSDTLVWSYTVVTSGHWSVAVKNLPLLSIFPFPSKKSLACTETLISLARRRQKQEDQKFNAILDYITSLKLAWAVWNPNF